MTSDDTAAFARLTIALRAVGDALGQADLELLLATELELGAALEGMARLRPGVADVAMTASIDEVRSALLRCRRLGASLVDFTRSSLDPSGETGYSRAAMRPAIDRVRVPVTTAPAQTVEARG